MLHFQYERGTYGDFQRLKRFHYCQGRPTLAAVWRVVYQPLQAETCARTVEVVGSPRRRFLGEGRELAGVLVLSFPVPLCAERHAVFGTSGLSLPAKMAWANANLRTISRLIIHPRFRGVGLAAGLVHEAIRICPTRYLEARSHLASGFPFFGRAGMTLQPGATSTVERPAYYWCAVREVAETGVGVCPHSGQRLGEARRS